MRLVTIAINIVNIIYAHLPSLPEHHLIEPRSDQHAGHFTKRAVPGQAGRFTMTVLAHPEETMAGFIDQGLFLGAKNDVT